MFFFVLKHCKTYILHNLFYYLQRNEAAELEKKLALESNTEKLLAENVQELQKNVKSLHAEVKHFRDLRDNLHTVIDPLNVCLFLLIIY